MNAPPPDHFISRTAAAQILGCFPQRVTAMIKRGELPAFTVAGRIMLREPDVRTAARPVPVTPAAHDRPMTTALSHVCIHSSAPAAGRFAEALTAITDGEPPDWHPAVVAGAEDRGRMCLIPVGAVNVEIFEVPLPAAAPESLTFSVVDPDAAMDRLRAAGFTVDTPPAGLPVVATVTVAGVCVRLRPVS